MNLFSDTYIYLCKYPVTGCYLESKPVDISFGLIARRHFPSDSDASKWSEEKM